MTLITKAFSTPIDDKVLCAHCGLPVPLGLIDHRCTNQFCCAGCRAVYETITSCGLADYYKLRELAGEAGQPKSLPSTNRKYDSFDTEAFEKFYVTHNGSLKQTEFVLEGLTCGACVWLIEKIPTVLNGVIETRLSLREARLRVTWDPQAVSLSKIASLLDRFGYTPHVAKSVTKRELIQRAERSMVIDIAVAFALMGNLMLISAALYAGWLGTMDESMTRFLRYCAMVLGTISLSIPGRCFFVNAYRSIRNRVANLDLPIALALVAGGCAGIANTIFNRGESYFDSLSMLILLLLAGRYLQYRQQRRADAAVELLFNLVPSTIHVMRDGIFVDLPGEALESGDLVEVRAGELIPGDGHVDSGSTSIDQALLTGESRAVPVKEGDSVFAGSMNQSSVIKVRVNAVGSDTRVGRLMELVERGASEKPNAMRFADGIGRWFVPGVCIASLVTFLIWVRSDLSSAIDHSIAMLIVTCPCILALATPLTMAVSIGQLARRNILVKSAAALERLAGIRTIVFDKTGTLTHSDLQVVSFTGIARYQPLIAEVERHFNHPIARAVVDAYGHEPCVMDIDSISACSHLGVRARADGRTVLIGSERLLRDHGVKSIPMDDHGDCRTRIHASIDGTWVATIAFSERVREDAARTVWSLNRAGIDTRLLSGDVPAVAQRIARQVGILPSNAQGAVSPEQKLDAVQSLRSSGPIAMVGDGVNDAASLAAADVGIAVRGGAEASLAAADIYIASNSVYSIVEAQRTAQHTMRVVKRNFIITFAYNLIAAALAITGLMNPLIAAILMPLSSATTLAVAVLSVRQRSERQP